jgi:hypothetical protein
MGTVKVSVPDAHWLELDLNRLVLDHPKILESLSINGVDYLKIAGASVIDSDDGRCDRVLGYINHFNGLTALALNGSDLTDAGIANLPKTIKLTQINLAGTTISGTCFKSLSKFPQLKQLDASSNLLKGETLADLAPLAKLESLNLMRTRLTSEELTRLPKFPALKVLTISNNPKVDDTALKYIASSCTNLEFLNLKLTNVTIQGLQQLVSLKKLRVLVLGGPYSKSQTTQIEKLFPRTEIRIVSGPYRPDDKDIKEILAPLRHQTTSR